MKTYILGIDPGTFKSGYILLSLSHDNVITIIDKDHVDNNNMKKTLIIKYALYPSTITAIETIVSYGGTIGQTTLETAIWAGRFFQVIDDMNGKAFFIKRPDVKMNLCHKINGIKDKNITQALKDRFGDIGTKKNPGRLYNLKDGLVTGGRPHIWSSLAIAVTFIDKNIGLCL